MTPERAADREERALFRAVAFFLSDLKLGMTSLLMFSISLSYPRISSWPRKRKGLASTYSSAAHQPDLAAPIADNAAILRADPDLSLKRLGIPQGMQSHMDEKRRARRCGSPLWAPVGFCFLGGTLLYNRYRYVSLSASVRIVNTTALLVGEIDIVELPALPPSA